MGSAIFIACEEYMVKVVGGNSKQSGRCGCQTVRFVKLSYIGMKRMAPAKKKPNVSDTSIRRTGNGRRVRRRSPTFVVCIDNSGYAASLELHKIYRVVADKDALKEGDLRVVDESGEDYLYAAQRFVPIELPKKVGASVLRRCSRA